MNAGGSRSERLSAAEWEERLKHRVVRAQQAYLASKGKDKAVERELQLAITLFSNLICHGKFPPEPYFEPLGFSLGQRVLRALAAASSVLMTVIFPERERPHRFGVVMVPGIERES